MNMVPVDKQNAISVPTSTQNYSISTDELCEEQKELEHPEDVVGEVPQLHLPKFNEESKELEEDPEEESSEELGADPEEVLSSEGEEYEELVVRPEAEEPSVKSADCQKEEPCMEQYQRLSNGNVNRIEAPSTPTASSSNEKKRSLHVTAAESNPFQDYQLRKKCRQDISPVLKAECISAISDPQGKSGLSVEHKDECASEQRENSGSSGKRRRSRWDLQPEQDGKTGEDDRTSKRRKTRWVSCDSQSKLVGPLQLPDFRKEYVLDCELDSEFQELKAKIIEINQKLKKPEFQDDRPVYNDLGIRISTEKARLHKKLVEESLRIICKLKKSCTFNPPDDKPSKFSKKLYIPVNEYPGYNFIGLIMGPRGNTHKMMVKETGAKILLRGKGCTINSEKSTSANEDLHVRIEADNQTSLNAAVAMVEKLLIPIHERENAHKWAQLEELAKLNGTLRKEKACKVCGEQGHHHYACPDKQSTFKATVSCSTCSSNSRLRATCPLTSCSPLSNSLQGSSYFGLRSTPNTKIKPSREIDEASLYVGYLPSHVDDYRLKELFCPFGKLIGAKVIKDRMTGISKGYGFVKFENGSDAAVAIEHMNDFKMDGKMLAVRVAGQQSVLQNVKSQRTWPGPPGSLLPEQAFFPGTSCGTMFPSSIYSGHGGLLPKIKAIDSAPSSTVTGYHSDTITESRFYSFTNNMVYTSPNSTSLFPGDQDYTGS